MRPCRSAPPLAAPRSAQPRFRFVRRIHQPQRRLPARSGKSFSTYVNHNTLEKLPRDDLVGRKLTPIPASPRSPRPASRRGDAGRDHDRTQALTDAAALAHPDVVLRLAGVTKAAHHVAHLHRGGCGRAEYGPISALPRPRAADAPERLADRFVPNHHHGTAGVAVSASRAAASNRLVGCPPTRAAPPARAANGWRGPAVAALTSWFAPSGKSTTSTLPRTGSGVRAAIAAASLPSTLTAAARLTSNPAGCCRAIDMLLAVTAPPPPSTVFHAIYVGRHVGIGGRLKVTIVPRRFQPGAPELRGDVFRGDVQPGRRRPSALERVRRQKGDVGLQIVGRQAARDLWQHRRPGLCRGDGRHESCGCQEYGSLHCAISVPYCRLIVPRHWRAPHTQRTRSISSENR